MFEINVEETVVIISYSISRPALISELESIKAIVLAETTHKFDIANEPWAYPSYPFLNIYAFAKNAPKTFKWNIADDAVRQKFVDSLYILRNRLDACGVVDSRISAEILISRIVDERTREPLISIGQDVYELHLSASPRSASITDQFKTDFNRRITQLSEDYGTAVKAIQDQYKREVDAMREKDVELFPLVASDFFDGWSTFFYRSLPMLAKRFTYSPHYVACGSRTFSVDEEVRKYWRTPGWLAYAINGEIYPFKSNGSVMSTHHTRDTGRLCTGNVEVPRHLSYAQAKDFVRKIIEMLDLINVPSRTVSHLNPVDPYYINADDFLAGHCVEVNSVANTGNNEVSDGEII